MGHRSFRESRSPRRPHLAPAQAPQQQPQLSVSSITSHLARTQRCPGANSQHSQPGAPTHVLEVAPPHSFAARLFPARARAQTAGLPEAGRERFPGSVAHAPRAPATSRPRPQVVDAPRPRAALTPERMLFPTWIGLGGGAGEGSVREAERLPAICSSLFVFSSGEGGGKRREKERERSDTAASRGGPRLRRSEAGGEVRVAARSLLAPFFFFFFFWAKAGSLFANQ